MASRVPGTGFASTTHWIFPGPPRVGTFVTRIAQGYEPRRRKAERPNRAMLGAGAGAGRGGGAQMSLDGTTGPRSVVSRSGVLPSPDEDRVPTQAT